MPFVPLFLRTHLGASVAQIGMIQGTTAIVMAAATLLTPLLARRLGLVGTVVATELASLPFLLVIPLASGLPVVAVAMWARSSLMNMSWPVYNQISVEGIPARDRPLIAGWTNVAWSVAWLAGSVIGGRLAETSYTTGYFITAGLYAVGAVTSWLLLRHLEAPAAAEQSGAATA
jgi:predicted MFS family arabinose efflux permease